MQGSFSVNSAVLRICGLSYSPSCRHRVLNHLQRQDAQEKHTSLYLMSKMQQPHPLSCDVWNSYQYPRTKDRKQKLWEQFSRKYICCTDSSIGKTPTDKGISKTYYVPVQRMAGRGYSNRVLTFFFLPLITFEVARVRGYLRKSEGSLPVKLELCSENFCLWRHP
jgi:hypothetical protein